MKVLDSEVPGRIMELDGLRAFAALGVAFFHLYIYAQSVPQGPPFVSEFLLWFGPKRVDIFFLISGYVITTLLIKEKSLGAVSVRGFYIRRFFRIVPALYMYLAAVLLLDYLKIIDGGNVWAAAIFMTNILPHIIDIHNNFAVGHTWSISVEEQFYLLMPLVLLVLNQSHKKVTFLAVSIVYMVSIISLAVASRAAEAAGPSWVASLILFICGNRFLLCPPSTTSNLISRSNLW
ncbi:acyltransferase family protein [Zhongshania sp.]|jgi:peptidoglycan/LPS O-acetylase OafA/YrhL|uniref:acyltransferase family protein n=1 Tax=Zhongshania sp. TaxID=1971902 RepID=UPI0039E59F4E